VGDFENVCSVDMETERTDMIANDGSRRGRRGVKIFGILIRIFAKITDD